MTRDVKFSNTARNHTPILIEGVLWNDDDGTYITIADVVHMMILDKEDNIVDAHKNIRWHPQQEVSNV